MSSEKNHGTGLFAKMGAVALLAIPFIPLTAVFGEFLDSKGLYTPVQWLLGGLIIGLPAALLLIAVPKGFLPAVRQSISRILDLPAFVPLALFMMALLLWFISWRAFSFFPLLVDEVVQYFQAKIFADGELTAPRPPLTQFFITQHIVVDDGRWYSQYPPGHSLLIALGMLVGLPIAVPIALTCTGAYALYRFVRNIYGEQTGRATLLLMLLCPFALFMGGSFMNHVSTFCFTALALWAFSEWEEKKRASLLLACGAALGAAFLSRPLCALAAGGAMGLWALPTLKRDRQVVAAALGIAGFSAVAAIYFAYNHLVTGNAFLPGYIKLWGKSHGLGFHESPWGRPFTPWIGLKNQVINVSMLNEFLFETPVPGLIPLAALLFFPLAKWDRRLLLLFCAFPFVYFFYWHRDSYLGPRFLYCALLAILPLSVRGIRHLLAHERFTRPTSAVLLLCFVYMILLGWPLRLRIYETSWWSVKKDVPREARENGITEGVVFVHVTWGERILSDLRGTGYPASAAEIAYQRTDHCLLHHFVERAKKEKLSVPEIEKGLLELRRTAPVVNKLLEQDPNFTGKDYGYLRSAIEPDAECIEQLRYDQRRGENFLPFILANSPSLDGKLIFAKDLRHENAKLMEYFPGRPAYFYRDGVFRPITISTP